MDITEKAREKLVEDRQHQEHLQETMLSRTQTEVENGEADQVVLEQAREALAKHLQQEEHVQESMLERAEEEIK